MLGIVPAGWFCQLYQVWKFHRLIRIWFDANPDIAISFATWEFDNRYSSQRRHRVLRKQKNILIQSFVLLYNRLEFYYKARRWFKQNPVIELAFNTWEIDRNGSPF